jgi:hypothetical protein
MLQIKLIRFNCIIYRIKCEIYKRKVISLKIYIYIYIYNLKKKIRDTNEKWKKITI